MARKLLGNTPNPSIYELTFFALHVPALPQPAVATLASINRHTPMAIAEVDEKGEWFRLEADDLTDAQLFQVLRKNWALVSGHDSLSFALIHCQSGKDRGVWLHHLCNWNTKSEYLHGCHQIPSWS